jgi:hypothetical protein
MELKGTYKLTYTIDREPKDLVLVIELKWIDGLMKKGQNVWEGIATLDGQPFEKYDLSHCVNAKTAVERIGHALRDEIKAKCKADGQSFRIKKEEIK